MGESAALGAGVAGGADMQGVGEACRIPHNIAEWEAASLLRRERPGFTSRLCHLHLCAFQPVAGSLSFLLWKVMQQNPPYRLVALTRTACLKLPAVPGARAVFHECSCSPALLVPLSPRNLNFSQVLTEETVAEISRF